MCVLYSVLAFYMKANEFFFTLIWPSNEAAHCCDQDAKQEFLKSRESAKTEMTANFKTHKHHYVFIYLLKTYSPVIRTVSPQSVSLVQISHKLNRIQTYTLYTNVKHISIVRKLSIRYCSRKKKRQIKFGDAGTTH